MIKEVISSTVKEQIKSKLAFFWNEQDEKGVKRQGQKNIRVKYRISSDQVKNISL